MLRKRFPPLEELRLDEEVATYTSTSVGAPPGFAPLRPSCGNPLASILHFEESTVSVALTICSVTNFISLLYGFFSFFFLLNWKYQHAVALPEWVLSRFSGFLPQSKDVCVRLSGNFKLAVGVIVSVCVSLSMSALWWTGHLSRVDLMFCSMTAGLEQKCNPELDQGWVDGWKYSVQSVLLEKMIVGRTTQVQIFD